MLTELEYYKTGKQVECFKASTYSRLHCRSRSLTMRGGSGQSCALQSRQCEVLLWRYATTSLILILLCQAHSSAEPACCHCC